MLDNSERWKMDNPDKFARYDTQDEGKKNKRHNTVCVGDHYTQIT